MFALATWDPLPRVERIGSEMSRPPLSVILATIEPWPDLARCLEVLEPQVAGIGGEIIVGDGHGEALEAGHASSSALTWIRSPGTSVFELRARAMEVAKGEIVATTEDHCVIAPDWCEAILKAFQSAPGMMAMTGPVINGSQARLIDWANYLHTFGCFAPPINTDQRERCPPNANVAYRRSVIPEGTLSPGWIELVLNPQLFSAGLFGVTEDMTVTHVQSHGLFGTLGAHFDNGRSTTGLRHISLSRRQLPWHVYRGTVRTLSRSASLRPVIRRTLPLLFVLSCCHALGEVAGIIAGPGKSPTRVR
jgi:hypothetical protein